MKNDIKKEKEYSRLLVVYFQPSLLPPENSLNRPSQYRLLLFLE